MEAALAAGIGLAFAIDWQGHRALKRALPGDVVGCYLVPPSVEESDRMSRMRGDADELIRARMACARDELAHQADVEFSVINLNVAEAVERVRLVLHDARRKRLQAG